MSKKQTKLKKIEAKNTKISQFFSSKTSKSSFTETNHNKKYTKTKCTSCQIAIIQNYEVKASPNKEVCDVCNDIINQTMTNEDHNYMVDVWCGNRCVWEISNRWTTSLWSWGSKRESWVWRTWDVKRWTRPRWHCSQSECQ